MLRLFLIFCYCVFLNANDANSAFWGGRSGVNSTKAEKIVVPQGARCPVCGMIVSHHPQWATQIDYNGESFYFDGVKDTMKYYFENAKKFDKIYVSDYYKLTKTDARAAFYVLGSNVLGPMGDELIPFANRSDAETFTKDHDGKRILSFDEIDEKIIDEL